MKSRLSLIMMVAALLALLGGCASVTSGTSQSVVVSTTPHQGAQCTLTNGTGTWTVPTTPGSATVARGYSDLVVTCATPEGASGTASVPSSTAGTAFGNILLGGVVGAAVDMSSGAAFEYPSTILVTLAEARPGATAVPAAVTSRSSPSSSAASPPSAAPGSAYHASGQSSVVCRVGQSVFPTTPDNCTRAGGSPVTQ